MLSDATVLRRRGKEARDQAQTRAGSARINSAAWYPSLVWLRDLGYRSEAGACVGAAQAIFADAAA